jgi:anti-sigma regulatory factor (Ser/Thr protein kinase)
MAREIISLAGYLNGDYRGFHRLFRISDLVRNSTDDIEFAFGGCNFLAPNAVSFIGGLTVLALREGRQVFFDRTNLPDEVRSHIERNGFLDAFQLGNNRRIKDTTVPFRVDEQEDTNAFTDYLANFWLTDDRIHIEPNLRNALVSCVIEAYINVFDHADSQVGVATCGQFFPKIKELTLTLVDFGVGIPHNVRAFLREPDKPDIDAIGWAFQAGNTTKRDKSSRGLGLKLLKNFVQKNNGKLEVYSDNGYIALDSSGEHTFNYGTKFSGTVIQITLRCDDLQHYALDDVLDQVNPDDPLF